MSLGADGSLCRVTSSAKDLLNNVKIIKVPNSEPTYRLLLIKPNDEDKESSKESDDEEISEDEFPLKNIENDVVADKKLDVVEKPNETVNEGVTRGHNHRNKQRHQHKKNNYHGQNNNFKKAAKMYNCFSNLKGAFEYGNKDLYPKANINYNSSGSRDFNSKASPNLAFKIDNFQHSDMHPQPWMHPPAVLHSNLPFTQFPHLPLPENQRNLGLLGHHPAFASSLDQPPSFTPLVRLNFSPSTNSDAFICDQTSVYSPMPSNSHNNSFIHNQNSSFTHMSSNYHLNKQVGDFGRNYLNHHSNIAYHKNNQFRNKHSNINNKQKQNYYSKKSRRHHSARNNASRNHPSRNHPSRNNQSFDNRM